MTNPRYQHVIVVMDRSGSISHILAGMQDGFREFISSQAALMSDGILDKVTASLWQFDDHIDRVHFHAPVQELASYEIVPRGMTSLFDAVGRAVTEEGQGLAALPEDQRPDQVVLVIASDGQENNSAEWEGPQVRALLEQQQRDYKWQVVYMGTNQDAFREARKLGSLTTNSVMSYASNDRSTAEAWRATSRAVRKFSSPGGQSAGVAYTDEDRRRVREGE